MLTSDLDKEEKIDRLAGFLVGLQRLGYSLNDAWDLLLHSTEGLGILNEEYAYAVHHQGIASAQKADSHTSRKYRKDSCKEPDIEQMKLLAHLIEMAHRKFRIPYEDLFSRTDPETFMKECGNVLGNYDDKLIQRYLM